MSRSLLLVSAALAFLFVAAEAPSQVTTADVVGTVTDTSGAVLQSATITIENIDTRSSRTATSGESGSYVFTFLPIGNYTLRVVSAGFKEFVVPRLTLGSGDRLRVDAQMSIGERAEKVEVQAQATTLQTDSSQLGSLITTKAVQDLPLNGRNFISSGATGPGRE